MDLQSDDAVKMYLHELALIQPLTKDEETKLFQRLRNRDEHAEIAERQLIESKLSLVVSIVERHSAASIPLLDLIQEGNLGLFNAVKTFAESGSDDFSAHAAACIEDAISKAIVGSK
ncbi:MAG: polymerase sigma factor [Candidatus Sulfotelmatobacter sp.]|nr:polymerase sigma factor [Candidatus Sulfotelmatobacter sp.]